MGIADGEQPLTPVTTAAEWKFINRELQENGKKVNTDEPGLQLLKHIGLELETSPLVGVGRFVVNERTCQPFGLLHGGMTGLIAESMASKTGQCAAAGQPVQSIELNANHLRAVPIGDAVVVIAKPMMKGGRIQVWEVKFEKEIKKKNAPPDVTVAAVCRVTLLVGSAIESISWKTPTAESRL